MDKRIRNEGDPEQPIADPQKLARNLALVAERSAGLITAMTHPEAVKSVEERFAEDVAEGMRTFGKVAQAWFTDPQRLAEANLELWQAQFRLWQSTMRRFFGGEAAPVAEPAPGDKRFQDSEWRTNAVFDFLKQSYLIASGWAQRMVDEADELDPHTRHKASFYVRQLSNALSPTNFVLTNPEVLRETLRTSGENLVNGIDNLAEDLERGHGELRIRQTDLDAFKVGENLALTPGKVVFQNELCQLIQYAPTTREVFETPLLIVPPWINKFYILDLTPEKSFIAWAVAQGHTVFVVSWVNPDERLAAKTFEDYMREGILEALDAVLGICGTPKANIVGYCVGGTLLAATLAYLAARHDDRVESATLLTTQVDFTHAGDLLVFVDEEQIESLERRMARHGYLEGSSMAKTFNLLRSNDLIWSYVINNYLLGKDPFPFDLLYWNSDSTRMPAANHIFYLRQCYLENRLARGEMVLGGETIDVGRITVPVYNLATREDHIAPAQSVFIGGRLFGGPVRFVLAGSGHIAGVVNPPDRQKYQHWADGSGETLEAWLSTAAETPGSWWPDWQRWLEPHAGRKVKARKPGRGKYKPIEDAPGSFVRMRAD